MAKQDDRLKDLDVRLDDISCRAITPPDDDDENHCPKHDPEPGGVRN